MMKTTSQLSVMALIALAGCGGRATPSARPIHTPSAPLDLELSPVPSSDAQASPPSSLSSYAPPALPEGSLTFTDQAAGISLDYPSGWSLIQPTDEAKAGSTMYSTTFHSYALNEAGQAGVPEDGTKVDLTIVGETAESLEAFAAAHPEWAPGGAEGIVTLPSGVRALRVEMAEGESMAGPVVTWLAVVGDQPVLLSGIGDPAMIDGMAGTLRGGD